MSGISLVLAVFVCTPDTLYCTDRSRPDIYADPPACHAQAELRQRELKAVFGRDMQVFTRCRYIMAPLPAAPRAPGARTMM